MLLVQVVPVVQPCCSLCHYHRHNRRHLVSQICLMSTGGACRKTSGSGLKPHSSPPSLHLLLGNSHSSQNAQRSSCCHSHLHSWHQSRPWWQPACHRGVVVFAPPHPPRFPRPDRSALPTTWPPSSIPLLCRSADRLQWRHCDFVCCLLDT